MSSKHRCPECELVFESHSKKANHIKWHHRSTEAAIEKIRAIKKQRKGQLVVESRQCPKCDGFFEVRYYSNLRRPPKKHCSRSCANSRVQTDDTKAKMRVAIKKKWKEGCYDGVHQIKVERSRVFSSKNERAIRDYIKQKYPEDGWKSGGCIIVEGRRISRDLYSDKLKVCFEYDGIWHFKDIHGQLVHKQEVDSLLERWCCNNGYRLVRIDEDVFVSLQQVEELLYQESKAVIKIGNRYF